MLSPKSEDNKAVSQHPTFEEKFNRLKQAHHLDAKRLLKAYPPEDSSGFCRVVQAVESAGIGRSTMADRLGVNRGTVSRWSSGKSVPMQYSREAIVRHLLEMLNVKC